MTREDKCLKKIASLKQPENKKNKIAQLEGGKTQIERARYLQMPSLYEDLRWRWWTPWIACDVCNAWMHQRCIPPDHQSTLEESVVGKGDGARFGLRIRHVVYKFVQEL